MFDFLLIEWEDYGRGEHDEPDVEEKWPDSLHGPTVTLSWRFLWQNFELRILSVVFVVDQGHVETVEHGKRKSKVANEGDQQHAERDDEEEDGDHG